MSSLTRTATRIPTRTHYERAVLRDARDAFDNPFRTPISAFAHMVERRGRPSDAQIAALMDGETGAVVVSAASGVAALGELAMRTLRPEAVWASFRREGHRGVRGIAHVRRLALWEVDEVADGLRKKYLLLGAALGAAAGAAGVSALTLDAPVITALAMRAIGDVALHYGFDVREPEERAFAMKVLIASIVPGVSVDAANLDDLGRVGAALSRTWKRRTRQAWGLPFALHVVRRLLRKDSGTSLLRRMVGLATAGANAWLMIGVTETAQAAYRRRFLERATGGRRTRALVESSDAPEGATLAPPAARAGGSRH